MDLSPEQRPFHARLQRQSKPIPAWDFDVLAGAGGLRSTAPDMLAWVEANLHPERVHAGSLSAALVSSHQVRSTIECKRGVALAWMYHPDSGAFEHAGAILAFTADTFFNPKDDVAVVVLSNVGPGRRYLLSAR